MSKIIKHWKLSDKGDKIQAETQPSSILCIISLKLYNHMHENENIEAPNKSELSV